MNTSEAQDFLGRRHMVAVLTEIVEEYEAVGKPRPLSHFAPQGSTHWRTRYIRIHEMAQEGLLVLDRGGQFNKAHIVPTDKGLRLYAVLKAATAVLGGAE